MEVIHIQQIKQAQKYLNNNNKSDSAKLKNITNGIAVKFTNRKNDDIDNDYMDNETKRYELVEAKNAVKYIQHFVQKIKYIVDKNPAKPKDYDAWTNEEQYKHITENIKIYVPNLPNSLHFFISAALHRGDCGRSPTDRPPWLDMDKFRRGQKFARDYIFIILFSNMISLFELFVFTDGLKPLIFSQQSHTPYLAFRRYLSTIRRIRNWMMGDIWEKDTQAYKDIQAVRKMHRAIRLKLCQLDYDEIDAATKIQEPWCPDRKTILDDFFSCPYPTPENGCLHLIIRPKGLNQADMGATQFAFMGMIVLYPQKLGINASDEDITAYCHFWRCIGYALGMQDEYNFCRGSLEEIRQRGRDFTNVWVKPYLRQITPEWEHMMRCIMSIYDEDNMFKQSLLFITDLLDIDMPRLRSTLTFSQRLQFMLHRFIFRYALKVRFIRECFNKIFLQVLEKFTSKKLGTLPNKYNI
ncbi:uncharacterized protein LOC114934621 [Nylanderia fulva]|uniref:uncharacterized protein LOC114934621 n=1 Tax=Nylanderia fulva TaxID=613905 RepID=UPI0010FB5157|nr:uncharacterized protein LOC114934621 [Nylanderia fulva]XP_029163140.1 uncharacterized protein LOC114934621 [Nylanderia fulva]XP_029163141.1 uncharacterized protein LOC114934621 [Nylanderia fulva]